MRHLELLIELLKQPTAPFREQQVVEFVTGVLRRRRIPFFLDPVGNVVVGCASPAEYRRLAGARSREPLRVYIAHLDHPGFHGVRWLGPGRLRARWHGGAPTRHLRGAAVWLADDAGGRYHGQIRAARLTRGRGTIDSADIALEPRAPRPPAARLYGGFRFRAPVWRAGRRVYAHVADDLVGVFAILATAIAHAQRRSRTPFLGLLTRAEEVGFVGAIGHFELGWLARARREVICISLETSRALPQAEIGKGPVVRLGDRRTVFAPGALNVLTRVAQQHLPARHQRRIMDGGTCEATAATAYGLPAVGISVPLGNYHNQSFEGGPGARGARGPAPEFVHLDDVAGLLRLCEALLEPRLPWAAPWREERQRLKQRLRDYRTLL